MPMRRGPCCRGARLTACRLAQESSSCHVQVDGAAASTILRGLVGCAIVGSDRIAANGDVADKIRHRRCSAGLPRAGVPFVVAAPWSTVDLATASGEDIPRSRRSGVEVTSYARVRGRLLGSEGLLAFDVTPTHGVGDRH